MSAGRAEQGHVLLEVVISVFLLSVAFTSLARLTLAASPCAVSIGPFYIDEDGSGVGE